MDHLIRPIEPRDQERVLGIISKHSEETGTLAREYFKDYFDTEPRDPSKGRHYVVEIGDEVFALGGYLASQKQNQFWVGFLYVDPYYQGQRIGSNLLGRLIDDTTALGGEFLFVSISADDIPRQATKFYDVNGFEELETNDEPPIPSIGHCCVYGRKLGAAPDEAAI